MSINLNDLLGDQPWLLWLVLASLLAAARLLRPTPWLTRVALALLPAAVAAALWPGLAGLPPLLAGLGVGVVVLAVRLGSGARPDPSRPDPSRPDPRPAG